MIKYPNGTNLTFNKISKTNKKDKNYLSFSSSNRGMQLEEDINVSNDYYRLHDIALITKRPTPINVVKVDYKTNKITNAYFEKQSTTDYNGIYKGKYIDIEAKNTQSKTSFPFTNIHPHQIDHLTNVLKHGGFAYFIIRFEKLDETYLLEAKHIIKDYGKIKSMKIETIKNLGHLITKGFSPRLDYLKIIDSLII